MLNEIFVSIQGEGFFCGKKALFIRFQGCNFRCSWCDEPLSLEERAGFSLDKEKVLELLRENNLNHVVLTGGEPLINEYFDEVYSFFKEQDLLIQIETNGSFIKESSLDLFKIKKPYLTISPKAFKNFYVDKKLIYFAKENYENVEIKFVADKFLNKEIFYREEFRFFLEKGRVIIQLLHIKDHFELELGFKILDELYKDGFTNVRLLAQMQKCLGIK